MVLKFHMPHDKAAGLQNEKIQAGWESIWTLLLKIAKPLKSTFPPEPINKLYLAEILCRALLAP